VFITKKSINRRSMLKGLGAALSLPLLDSMIPAFAEASNAPIRLAWFYLPNGIDMRNWTPPDEGPLPPTSSRRSLRFVTTSL
jgi:hypothetical protein